MTKKKQIDPLPDQFASYDEAGEFWDKHDTMVYSAALLSKIAR